MSGGGGGLFSFGTCAACSRRFSVASLVERGHSRYCRACAKKLDASRKAAERKRCPHCGRDFAGLSRHLKACPKNPANEEPPAKSNELVEVWKKVGELSRAVSQLSSRLSSMEELLGTTREATGPPSGGVEVGPGPRAAPSTAEPRLATGTFELPSAAFVGRCFEGRVPWGAVLEEASRSGWDCSYALFLTFLQTCDDVARRAGEPAPRALARWTRRTRRHLALLARPPSSTRWRDAVPPEGGKVVVFGRVELRVVEVLVRLGNFAATSRAIATRVLDGRGPWASNDARIRSVQNVVSRLVVRGSLVRRPGRPSTYLLADARY
ncbi:MAG: hypothetical protein Kow0069_13730 [Promethearchaeota archaeon]